MTGQSLVHWYSPNFSWPRFGHWLTILILTDPNPPCPGQGRVLQVPAAPWVCRHGQWGADLNPRKNIISGILLPFSKPALSPFSTIKVGESAEKDGQTLLVPTNAAFDKLPEDLNGRLLADKEFAQKVVQRHLLDEVLTWSISSFYFFILFSGSLLLWHCKKQHLLQQLKTKSWGGTSFGECWYCCKIPLFCHMGHIVSTVAIRFFVSSWKSQVRRTASGHLYADKAEISKCDMMAGNGVVLQVFAILLILGRC